MEYIFKIFRFDPKDEKHPRSYFQEFLHEPGPNDSIIEALMAIRNQQDPTLSFRYSCREAICGSCAMVINGTISLACKTTVASLNTPLITIEPLPNLKVQKDLMVDMEPFFSALEQIKPYLQSNGEPPPEGHKIEEKDMEKIDQFTTCIMCGCCYSACPVASRDERYLGPIALAKLYRFVQDPRDRRDFSDWVHVNSPKGLWGCDTVFKCNDVCPKKVRPADGIIALRKKMIIEKSKRIFKRKP